MTNCKSSPTLEYEISLSLEGFKRVVGIDEAGRGTWAGPVYAGAVILEISDQTIAALSAVNDSKKMTEEQREKCFQLIQNMALAWGIGQASNEEIDQLGIVPATELAVVRAVQGLSIQPDFALVDAFNIRSLKLPQQGLVKGDAKSLSIAAASILAKVARDRHMVELAQLYPGYGFEVHKGYGTVLHRKKLIELGVSDLHRRTFRPIKDMILSKTSV